MSHRKLRIENTLLKKKNSRLTEAIKFYESQKRTIHGQVTHKKARVANARVELTVIGKPEVKIKTRTDRIGMFSYSFKATDVDEGDEVRILVSKKGYKACCETIGFAVVQSVEIEMEGEGIDE